MSFPNPSGDKKIQVIKEVRARRARLLGEAKAVVDTPPPASCLEGVTARPPRRRRLSSKRPAQPSPLKQSTVDRSRDDWRIITTAAPVPALEAGRGRCDDQPNRSAPGGAAVVLWRTTKSTACRPFVGDGSGVRL
jgi:hypothetical protein